MKPLETLFPVKRLREELKQKEMQLNSANEKLELYKNQLANECDANDKNVEKIKKLEAATEAQSNRIKNLEGGDIDRLIKRVKKWAKVEEKLNRKRIKALHCIVRETTILMEDMKTIAPRIKDSIDGQSVLVQCTKVNKTLNDYQIIAKEIADERERLHQASPVNGDSTR